MPLWLLYCSLYICCDEVNLNIVGLVIFVSHMLIQLMSICCVHVEHFIWLLMFSLLPVCVIICTHMFVSLGVLSIGGLVFT